MKKIYLALLVFAIIPSIHGQNIVYDENVDGELSTDHTNPTGPFVLEEGPNTIVASQGGDGASANYFSFTLSESNAGTNTLSKLFLDNYTAASGNQAFLGIQEGESFTTDASNTAQADLLGGILYGSANVGDDVLPIIADLSGAQGFDIPLEPGTYTIWLNQTGPESEVTLRFEVDQTLSIENQDKQLFSIFPNPAQDIVTVQAPNTIISEMRIVDITGKTLLIENASTRTKAIDVSALRAGIYLLSVSTAIGKQTQRFIKI